MRKMSELLEICKTVHISYGGVYRGMCDAAKMMRIEGVITKEEEEAVKEFCTDLVSSLIGISIYLSTALILEIYPQYSKYSDLIKQTMAQIYDCCIDKLKSENL